MQEIDYKLVEKVECLLTEYKQLKEEVDFLRREQKKKRVLKKEEKEEILFEYIRTYIKRAKKKSINSREKTSQAVQNMATTLRLNYPEDILEELDNLDAMGEQDKLSVNIEKVNDIHGNEQVCLG